MILSQVRSLVNALVLNPGSVHKLPVPVPYYIRKHAASSDLRWSRQCLSLRAHVQRIMIPPSLLVISQEVAWLILECARRTRPFRGRAFREQEDDQATSLFRFRAPRKGCRGRRRSERVHTSFWSDCIEFSNDAGPPALCQPRSPFCMMPRNNVHAVRHMVSPSEPYLTQTGRTICTAASLSILPTGDTFPSRSLRTIFSICTMAPRCQLSTAAF